MILNIRIYSEKVVYILLTVIASGIHSTLCHYFIIDRPNVVSPIDYVIIGCHDAAWPLESANGVVK